MGILVFYPLTVYFPIHNMSNTETLNNPAGHTIIKKLRGICLLLTYMTGHSGFRTYTVCYYNITRYFKLNMHYNILFYYVLFLDCR